jgi:hypothetical protein
LMHSGITVDLVTNSNQDSLQNDMPMSTEMPEASDSSEMMESKSDLTDSEMD